MRYVEPLYRPPSEADSFILQATLGCSWNKCTYCDMYRSKQFVVRPADDVLEDIAEARRLLGPEVDKVFVADGDALVMSVAEWLPVLEACRAAFPRLRRISCYAMATNILAKSPAELSELRAAGLSLLYVGPESGDDRVLKRIAKGSTRADHVAAASRAHDADLALSVIFLLGVAGVELSQEHAHASGSLATDMDPQFLAALTVSVIPGTPLARLADQGRFQVPEVPELLAELRAFIATAAPTDALFRTNHASNHLPVGGRLPRDRERILATIDEALRGERPLRAEWMRGL